MAKIADLLGEGQTLSFEFAPPRTEEAHRRLEKTVLSLEPLQPSFVSVTYGAGGSTRDTTREIVEHIHRDTSLTPMPHLTCVAQRRDGITDLVRTYSDEGLENLLALAGDPPLDNPDAPSDFAYATELIEIAREVGDFSIGVAAFPEMHPRSPDRESDRRRLAEKLQAADFGITQFFFRAEDYFHMVDELAALGVDKPVIPGLIVFANVEGLRRMSGMNAAVIPDALQEGLDRVDGDPTAIRQLAVDTTTRLGQELLDGGAPGLHLCTLNYARATKEICANLGLGSAS